MQKPQMRAGTIETSNSEAKHAVVHAQTDRSCLGPIETCHSGPEVAVLHAKTTGRVLDPQRLVILVSMDPCPHLWSLHAKQ